MACGWVPSGASHTDARFAPFVVICCVLRGWVPSGASHTAVGFATCVMSCPGLRGWVASGTSHTSGGVCTVCLACARLGDLMCLPAPCRSPCVYVRMWVYVCVCRYAGVLSDTTSVGVRLWSCQNATIEQFKEHN